MSKRILIIGGYGVFGGRLARLLLQDARFDVRVAGRSKQRAEAFCKAHGGTAYVIDLSADKLEQVIASCEPLIIVDAAGPFQTYDDTQTPYRLAKAAIACGAHYIDLSDDAGFTRGISALDAAAKTANVAVLSGVSSVPALSSSIVSALTGGMADIHAIESVILPGNKAPRGLSVVRAIVGQAGQTMRIWKSRQWRTVKAWSGRETITLDVPGIRPVKKRWASYIGAPDLDLFPDHYNARSVSFRAGLDLKIMHGGLALLSLPVRWGWLKTIGPLSPVLKWMADRLEKIGSARGGMRVQVCGTTHEGIHELRQWTLIAEDGDGPFIPAIPGQILCGKLIDGAIESGARPALNTFSKLEAEHALGTLRTEMNTETKPLSPLFASALGAGFETLPAPLRALHTILTERRWTGEASITRGTSILSKLIGAFVGFPPATKNTAVEVSMVRTSKGETWTRTFGAKSFRSYLSQAGEDGDARVQERFGLLTFAIALKAENGALQFPVTYGKCLGIPLPKFLLPKSETFEHVDALGRACFDVTISMPIAGQIVTYKGWLEDA